MTPVRCFALAVVVASKLIEVDGKAGASRSGTADFAADLAAELDAACLRSADRGQPARGSRR